MQPADPFPLPLPTIPASTALVATALLPVSGSPSGRTFARALTGSSISTFRLTPNFYRKTIIFICFSKLLSYLCSVVQKPGPGHTPRFRSIPAFYGAKAATNSNTTVSDFLPTSSEEREKRHFKIKSSSLRAETPDSGDSVFIFFVSLARTFRKSVK